MGSEKASNSFFFIKKILISYLCSHIRKSSLYFLRKGLTLIELSIVVALLGVIFTGIFSTYYTSLKISRNTTPKGGTSRQNIFFAIENIRSTLSQTYYVDGHRNLVFVGKTDGVQNARRDMVTFAANHPNAEEIDSLAQAFKAVSGALSVLKDIQVSNSKIDNNKELKEMDIKAKKELLQNKVEIDTPKLLFTREEIIKSL
jgi:prepilin-type N-terminal cleavage/methylation domain-containing protein